MRYRYSRQCSQKETIKNSDFKMVVKRVLLQTTESPVIG